MNNIQMTINQKEYSVPESCTILEAAKLSGIRIPTLCYMEKLTPRASCRMCVVEVEGMRNLQPACATKVREGMVVFTDSDVVRESRKLTLELILSDHNVDCHHCLRIGNSKCDDLDPYFCEMCFYCDCVKDGFCDLQALAREYKVDVLSFPQRHGMYEEDRSSCIIRNPNKCVKCRKCVDICNEVQKVHNLVMAGRGCETKIIPVLDKPMAESECVGCGRCVQICPTGAIYFKERFTEALYYAHSYEHETAVMIDERVLEELQEIFSKKARKSGNKVDNPAITMEMLAGSLKKIGFDHIYDARQFKQRGLLDASEKIIEELKNSEKENTIIMTEHIAAKEFISKNIKVGEKKDILSEVAVFGISVKPENPNKEFKTIAIVPMGDLETEVEKTGTVTLSLNARSLYRMLVRTGSEPSSERMKKLDIFQKLEADEVPEEMQELVDWLQDDTWEFGNEGLEKKITIAGKTLNVITCHNLGQLRNTALHIQDYDLIHAI